MMRRSADYLEYIAYHLRSDCLKATTAAGSGHPTSCLSAADVVAALFCYAMHYDLQNHHNPRNDRFVLSKGHAAPLLYAMYHQLGLISEQELLSLRKFGSLLEGHPSPRFAYVDAATGSLGQGLSIGLGQALAARLDNLSYYVYVLLGDSEMSEGSNWEAINLAYHYKAHNLVAILDNNRLGQSTQVIEDHHLELFKTKFEAFGWHTIMIDGHDMPQIMAAFDAVRNDDIKKPKVILAKTFKGHGLNGAIENHNGFHGKAFTQEELVTLLDHLQRQYPKAAVYKPTDEEYKQRIRHPLTSSAQEQPVKHVIFSLPKPIYTGSEKVATRKAYGDALTALGAIDNDVISLDAEVKNSTFAEVFEKKFPDRFFQCFVAEQNMIGMGVGFAIHNKAPFISTFAAFLSRAHDQIRMAAISGSPLRIIGSHCGVSIGQDGPSQMGLEDIAMMRALPRSIILYPCDAMSTYKLLVLMVDYEAGISYLRTTRGETPIIYNDDEDFSIGGCKTLRSSQYDSACVIAAGITVVEALKAYEILQQKNIFISVIDCYSVKPLPVAELLAAAKAANNFVITVEDHYREGGLGEAICYALRNQPITIECLAVTKLPGSGKPEELMAFEHIDAQAIVKMLIER